MGILEGFVYIPDLDILASWKSLWKGAFRKPCGLFQHLWPTRNKAVTDKQCSKNLDLLSASIVKDEANDLVTRYFIKPSDKVSINTSQLFIVNCVYCVNLYIQTFGFYGYQLNPFMETIIRLRARVQPNAHFSSIELE